MGLYDRDIEKIERRECPRCGHPLTDPKKSPGGWAWCRNPRCRKPWQILDQHGVRYVATMPNDTVKALLNNKEGSERAGE